MATTATSVAEIARAARAASREPGLASTEGKNAALERIAEQLEARKGEILAANEADLDAGRTNKIGEALLDRLALDDERIAAMAQGVREIAALPDPVGEIVHEETRQHALRFKTEKVPIGVIAIVYEARPNVTVDAAALCLKSGNAVVLRGSSSAQSPSAVRAAISADGVADSGLPSASGGLVAGGDRAEMAELATQEDY